VFHSNSTRMQRGKLPGTGISQASMSGTWTQPRSRAARAGKAASRSLVTVKNTAATSCGAIPLRAAISCSSARVADRMVPASFASTVVAPRTPRTLIGYPPMVRQDYQDSQD